ncbi:NAD(P)-dependent oxidoreductase [Terrarubrum flagellatum]|uniref:NAD(P)-dependent oxidoreductase n=1 Tax=Terrirubrum flagellatum TaxID=2895980 RepID=UPI00314539C7
MTTKVLQIGFIGLGAMGWPMASRLISAGHNLTAYDAAPGRSQSFASEVGGHAAISAAEVAKSSDFIVTMLPTSAHVASVLGGENGLLSACRPKTLIIEMSSGAPASTKEFGERVLSFDCRLIDAPVSGGVPRARTGELSIMVGGDDDDIARAESLLAHLGTSILRTGALGTAHAMKALNNLVSAATFLATVEALCIGKKAGLNPSRMVDILNVSTGMSNSSQKKMHQFVLSGNYNSGFGLDLMVKDLATAIGLARDVDATAPLSALCRDIWQEAAAFLGPGKDHTALARLVERTASTSLLPQN